MINIIVAHDKNRCIGRDNQLLCHIPEDLKYFKQLTKGGTIIMGRKTYESLPIQPLPDRTNVVLTRNKDYKPDKGVIVISDANCIMDDSIVYNTVGDIWVIGGGEIYKQFLPFASKLYITYIDYEFEGDVYFPEINQKEWLLTSNAKGIRNDKNPYDYYFQEYTRIN